MELELIRTYFPNGSNGEFYLESKRICFTIELPWFNNQTRISCIPEGKYELKKRYSNKFGEHLQLQNVRGRDLILIHPANDALKELKGCIAPVFILTAEGKGLRSRIALNKVKAIVFPELKKSKQVFLTIKSNIRETDN